MNEGTPNTPPVRTDAPADTCPPQNTGAAPAAGASGLSIAALILGILSILCCNFIMGIPAIICGHIELKNIREGRSNIESKTLANIGFILGIIGTALSFIAVLGYILMLILSISTDIWQSAK